VPHNDTRSPVSVWGEGDPRKRGGGKRKSEKKEILSGTEENYRELVWASGLPVSMGGKGKGRKKKLLGEKDWRSRRGGRP